MYQIGDAVIVCADEETLRRGERMCAVSPHLRGKLGWVSPVPSNLMDFSQDPECPDILFVRFADGDSNGDGVGWWVSTMHICRAEDYDGGD